MKLISSAFDADSETTICERIVTICSDFNPIFLTWHFIQLNGLVRVKEERFLCLLITKPGRVKMRWKVSTGILCHGKICH